MAISYATALNILKDTAKEVSANFDDDSDVLSIEEVVGRVSKYVIFSPVSTPIADTSAMDGFAVDSSCTQDASDATPVTLRVVGFVAAGDKTIRELPEACKHCHPAMTEYSPCIEIATGAKFPAAPYNACIRVEDTVNLPNTCLRPSHQCSYQYIRIVKPAKPNQHKRPAGEDFSKGRVVLHARETVQPQHAMALASVGINVIKVMSKMRIGILSTGSELVQVDNQVIDVEDSQVRNSNGPYLCTAVRQMGVQVDFIGLVEDDIDKFRRLLEDALSKQRYHVVLTTGAVSVGKFDFVREAIEAMGAQVKFHKVSGKSTCHGWVIYGLEI